MTTVAIDRIASETLRIPILGTSPLITHKFSEKAKRQMLDAMQGRKTPRQPKDPQADFESSLYLFPPDDKKKPAKSLKDACGFPVIAFKAATVGAARFYGKDVKMTELRQFIFMHGELGDDGQALARIVGTPTMREDVVRVGQGTDLRYRGIFQPWSTTLEVTYVTSALQRSSLLSLIDAGGMGVGIGEWRVEKRGDFGCYRVDPDREVEVIA